MYDWNVIKAVFTLKKELVKINNVYCSGNSDIVVGSEDEKYSQNANVRCEIFTEVRIFEEYRIKIGCRVTGFETYMQIESFDLKCEVSFTLTAYLV